MVKNQVKSLVMAVVAVAVAMVGLFTGALVAGPWSDTSLPPARRAALLMKEMNATEKINYVHGGCSGYVFNSCGVPRLGVPNMMAMDGPQGFRGTRGTSTAFPSGLTIGASFDVAAAAEWGAAMGKEFYMKGANVQLGPGACLVRAPLGGRAFEYISGEDPYLGYAMVQPAVQGIQSQGVVANVKHFVDNNQENNRNGVDVQVDERTQWELYYGPFQGAVDGGVGSVMCSLNRVNGVYACDSQEVLGRDLKQRMNFTGWVMSDYDGTHSTGALMAGLDQEMPKPNYMSSQAVLQGLTNGSITHAKIDDTVMRILTPLITVGAFDRPANATVQPNANVTSPAHNALARKLAAGSMVLLQNTRNTLPFTLSSSVDTGTGTGTGRVYKNFALFGDQARDPVVGGTGSGRVTPYYKVSPAGALMAHLGFPQDMVVEAVGCCHAPLGTPMDNTLSAATQAQCGAFNQDTDYKAYPSTVLNGTAASNDECCTKCFAAGPGFYYFTRVPAGTCYCHLQIGKKAPHKGYTSGACRTGKPPAPTPPPPPPPACHGGFCVTVYPSSIGSSTAAVATAAAKADAVMVFGATVSGEGEDRLDLSLFNGGRGGSRAGQDALIAAVGKAAAAAGKPSVAVVVTPGALLTPWSDDVDAVVAAFMPGQEYGNALVDVLFGVVSPSGRLPVTFPNKENEMAFTKNQYPGPDPCSGVSPPCTKNSPVYYTEKLEVGYRWYHAHNVTPKFAFGHGLSYSTFAYTNITAIRTQISVTITNTGGCGAAEVAQLYLDYPASAGEPPRQLKGFVKIYLAKGESKQISFELVPRDRSIWDVSTHGWKEVTGSFTAHVCTSSQDVKLSSYFLN